MSNNQVEDDPELEMECSSPISNCDGEENAEENAGGNVLGASAASGVIAVRGNIAHEFEPLARPDQLNEMQLDLDEDIYRGRKENLDWCRCRQCEVMDHFKDEECRCCQEIQETTMVAEEGKAKCVTEIPDFEQAVLNPLTLRLAWETFTQHYRKAARSFNDRGNEKYRYAAYRQFVRLCWGYLGRYIRVYTPACAHVLIDRTYPDHNNRYRGTVILRQLPNVPDDDDDDTDSDFEDELLD